MDQQDQSGTVQAGGGASSPMQTIGPHKGNTGAMIGIAVVVLILILGAIYFWMDTKNKLMMQEEQARTQVGEGDAQAQALLQTSSSDSASAIEADLQSTNLGNIDGELSATESQI